MAAVHGAHDLQLRWRFRLRKRRTAEHDKEGGGQADHDAREHEQHGSVGWRRRWVGKVCDRAITNRGLTNTLFTHVLATHNKESFLQSASEETRERPLLATGNSSEGINQREGS